MKRRRSREFNPTCASQHRITEINSTNNNVVSTIASPLFTIGDVSNPTETIADTVKYTPVIPFEDSEQLAKFFERPVQVYQWSVGSGQNLAMPSNTSIFSLWKAVAPVAAKLNGYKYFRGNLKLTLSYAGSPQALGTFGVAFFPYAGPSDVSGGSTAICPSWFVTDGTSFVQTKLQLPHFYAPLEQSKTTTMELPFPNAIPYLEIATGHDYSLSPMNVNSYSNINGVTVIPITMHLFASYTDVELFTPLVPQSGDETRYTLSSTLNYLSSLLGAVSTVAPIVTPWAHMTGAAGKFARALGYSRPPVIEARTVYHLEGTNTSLTSGAPDQSVRLAMDIASAVDTSGAQVPMSSQDDGNLMKIFTKPGMVLRDIPLTTSLTWHAVNPASCEQQNVTGYGAVNSVMPTPLSLAGYMFKKYSGGIDVYFEFVANAFIKANVGIVVVPAGSVLPVDVLTTPYTRRTVVSVVGRTVIKVHVPYTFIAPFTNISTPQKFAAVTASPTNITCVGVVLLDPIVTGTASTPTLKFNMSFAAADNFCVALPNLDNAQLLMPTVKDPGYYPESGDEKGYFESIESVPTEGRMIPMNGLPLSTYGEQILDVHELTKRSVYQVTATAPTTISSAMAFSYAGPVPNGVLTYGGTSTLLTVSNVSWTFHTLVSLFFFGVTGGIRYKLDYTNTPVISMGFNDFGPEGTRSISSIPPYSASYQNISSGGAVQRGDLALIEWEFPSRSVVAFREAWRNGSSTTQHASNSASPRLCLLTSTTGLVHIMQSSADDTRYHKFLCAPPMRTIAAPTPPPLSTLTDDDPYDEFVPDHRADSICDFGLVACNDFDEDLRSLRKLDLVRSVGN